MKRFRAWHEGTAEMVYFDPDKRDQYVSDHFYRLMSSDHMMQFTGMVDADAKKIYEGDLLDFNEKEWGEPFEPEVVPAMRMGEWEMAGAASDVAQWRRVVGNVWEGVITRGKK